MPELKLAKLPDRTPSKITITVSSDLNAALRQYADIYRSAYGEDEPVAELIPFMLEAFLESDREFARARKIGPAATTGSSVQNTQRREASPASSGREV
jgi:hypothetical protein